MFCLPQTGPNKVVGFRWVWCLWGSASGLDGGANCVSSSANLSISISQLTIDSRNDWIGMLLSKARGSHWYFGGIGRVNSVIYTTF